MSILLYGGKCVSDEFRQAFGAGGCSHVNCVCGRDNGEPDDGTGSGTFASGECVMLLDLGPIVADGCVCGSGPRHEAWVWDQRHKISAYLSAREKRELEEAQRTAAANLASLDALAELTRNFP
jgi:hypothetical protein